MIFIVELKRRVANASMFGIIIDNFCYRKKPCLVILFEIDKGSKINFHYTILPFGLIVHLWVEGAEESLLNVKEII